MAKVAIVTGASQGLGSAMCGELTSAGYQVMAIVRRRSSAPKACQEAVWDLVHPEAMPGVAIARLIRMNEGSEILLVLNAATLGPIDVPSSALLSLLVETMKVNYESPAALGIRVIEEAKRFNSPLKIILITSGVARNPHPLLSAYCTSKAAIEMFIRCIDAEFPGVQVEIVNPGVFVSRMQLVLSSTIQKDIPPSTPLAAEVAKEVLGSAGVDL